MKKVIPTLLFLACAFWTHAQFGITGAYRFNDATAWVLNDQNGARQTELLGDGFSFGIDYWLRLKSVRIEFLPELNYSQFRQDPATGLSTRARFYSLFLNTNFYLLDFFGDCDCPTFSKQNPIFQKGFFLQLSPGLSYADLELRQGEDRTSASSPAFSIGAAAGLDIGLSDLLTVTPLAGARYFFPVSWEGLNKITDDLPGSMLDDETSSIFQFYAALRLGFRFDH